jgi:hypothetical protein
MLSALALVGAASAQSEKPDIADQASRTICIEKLIQEYVPLDRLRSLQYESLKAVEGCDFSQSDEILALQQSIQKLNDSGQETPATLKFDEANAVQAGFARRSFKARQTIGSLNSAFISTAGDLSVTARVQGRSEEQVEALRSYPGAMLSVLQYITLENLTSGYDSYPMLDGEPNDSDMFRFVFREPQMARVGRFDPPLPGAYPSNDKCDNICRAYIEQLLVGRYFHTYWALNNDVILSQLAKDVDASLAKYEQFFFESGDGLYPWELWINSWGKSDNVFLRSFISMIKMQA